jgi:hypothetical protein
MVNPSVFQRMIQPAAQGPFEAAGSGQEKAHFRWGPLRRWNPFNRVFKPREVLKPNRLQVLVLINLIQDLDLLLPLAVAFQDVASVQLGVAVVDRSFHQSPRIGALLRQVGIEPKILARTAVVGGLQPNLTEVQALITASESTCGPHRAAHALTKRADRAGIPTFTLQHGFENVGLTYDDETYPAATTGFASQTIFLWGDPSTLHPDVPAETRQKCVGVGCPKYILPPETTPNFFHGRQKLVVVFENLHWHRYDDTYRQRFIQDVYQLAQHCPETTVLVKPHHAGLWLTHKANEDLPAAENLVIADPSQPPWETFTAPALLALADAAITTPSTVALDAARAQCPVAVVGYHLPLDVYRPLPILKQTHDWLAWLQGLNQTEEYDRALAQGKEFLAVYIKPGDAVSRIVEQVVGGLVTHR